MTEEHRPRSAFPRVAGIPSMSLKRISSDSDSSSDDASVSSSASRDGNQAPCPVDTHTHFTNTPKKNNTNLFTVVCTSWSPNVILEERAFIIGESSHAADSHHSLMSRIRKLFSRQDIGTV
mmetsp:Transcript_36782/g.59456  ORF Transcript_36782/g.59456 Transcript_36782/m.59456 type:complete len:121 (-) Transcript_36782:260-622(-)